MNTTDNLSPSALRTLARRLCGLLVVVSLLGISSAARSAGASVVTLNLDRYSKIDHLDAGDYVGVSPGRVIVHVGDAIVFDNTDSRDHTATSIEDASVFPQDPHWTPSALKFSGKIGEGPWTTGDLAPGARSAPIVAAKAGKYLYGCFYDYSAGMRGEIIVEP